MRLTTREPGSITPVIKLMGLAVISLLLAACNTWSGFGKDLQHLGRSIEDRAKESPSTDK